MDDLFKGLSSQAMLFIIFAWIGLFIFSFLLTIGFKKTKKNLSVNEWIISIGLITVFIGGFLVIIFELEYKNRLGDARLLEVIQINRGGENYLITISQSVTSGKSSTSYWLLYDILNVQTGKRVKRESLKLGNGIWDFKILGKNEQFIFFNHYGIKLLDPFGKSEFLGEAEIQNHLLQKMPTLVGKIAKVELKTENIGSVILVTKKTGELQCFGLHNFQQVDCQALSYPPGKLNPWYKPLQVLHYYNYAIHQWNDSTWLTLGLRDATNPYKSRLYQHKGRPDNLGDGIQVTITEGDSTRSLLPQSQPKTKTFPERLELFSQTDFLSASLIFCDKDRIYLKNVSEIGQTGKNLLTAYNLIKKQIDWQVVVEDLKLSSQTSPYYQVQIIQNSKNLLLSSGERNTLNTARLVCLDAQTGKIEWQYDFLSE
jgi:hypothetical protein